MLNQAIEERERVEVVEELKMKKYARKRKLNKEIEAEDWCFICKDGGDLVICDFGNCLKVYHAECAGIDESDSASEECWCCGRHFCLSCRKTPKYWCFCCPNALCEYCYTAREFTIVRGKNGFCNECFELVLLSEEDVAYNSDGEEIDFKDRDTHEGLFKEYWEIIKVNEGLTSDDVHALKSRLRKSHKHYCSSVSAKFGKGDKEDLLILSDSDEEEDSIEYTPSSKKKQSKKQEFIGWGSKPLINFLNSVGKDTTIKISHYEVECIINEYIQEKKLLDLEKKRKVLCDEKLYSIFRKKSIMKSKIYNLLESHFIENLELSEEEDHQKTSSVDNHDDVATCKKQKTLISDRKPQETKMQVRVRESCYASIVAENMKLVYLRRSLVEELMKQPENFEGKVVGSLVKIKTDTRDFWHRSSHQLLPVTGIKKTLTGEILLQIPQMEEDDPCLLGEKEGIHVQLLSDDGFTEEECKHLRERMQSGLLKQPTIVELEQKARSLHEDITKHWIKRELVLLQKRIDHTNERGWRREGTLLQYIEQKQLLMKPAEQERLLKQIPKVIAEAVEITPSVSSESDK